MTCPHLFPLAAELAAAGVVETRRGTPWTTACREWVYYDVVLNTDALSARLRFPACVRVHENRDPRSGTERGFVCTACHDAIMGRLSGAPEYP